MNRGGRGEWRRRDGPYRLLEPEVHNMFLELKVATVRRLGLLSWQGVRTLLSAAINMIEMSKIIRYTQRHPPRTGLWLQPPLREKEYITSV